MLSISQFAELKRLNAAVSSDGRLGTPLVGTRVGSRVLGLPPTQANSMRGSTTTQLGVPVEQRPVADVANQPSIKLLRNPDGSAETQITRKTKHADGLHDDDLEGVKSLVQQMVLRARLQSQGPLTANMLAMLGHPYGRNAKGDMRGRFGGKLGKVRGVRGSVSDLSVVNKNTGSFAAAWHGQVSIIPGGIMIRVINDKYYAGYLMLGTIKMQAHGPWTSAVNAKLPELNSEWQKVVRRARERTELEQQIVADVSRIPEGRGNR